MAQSSRDEAGVPESVDLDLPSMLADDKETVKVSPSTPDLEHCELNVLRTHSLP